MLISLFLMYVGWSGIVLDGEVSDIPTPNTPDRTYFSDEPLPEQVLAPFFVADLTLTWDRDDIYVVIVEEDEKKRCEATPPGLSDLERGSSCSSRDADIIVIGSAGEGQDGIEWRVDSGIYHVGMGSAFAEFPEGTDLNVNYAVHLHASFIVYFLLSLITVGGLAYSRVD